MKILPITPALLVSAAMRADHSLFMPTEIRDPIFMRPWQERIPERLEQARRDYDAAVRGDLSDVQVLEEFTGKGFYAPDREDHYLAALSGFPGMLDLAQEIAARGA